MTTLEARVAHISAEANAGPETARADAPLTNNNSNLTGTLSNDSPSPAAPAAREVSTISDYQAAKAALLASPPADAEHGAPVIPDDAEGGTARDEYGDPIHDPDQDAGPMAAPEEAAPATTTASERILPHRINTRQFDRTEQEAIALKHQLENANPGQTFSLKECLARVEAKYGAPSAETTPLPSSPDLTPEASLPRTVAELDALKRENAKAIRAKRAEIARAEADLRFEDKLTLTEELNRLEQDIETLEDYAPQVASVEEMRNREFTQAYAASAEQTVQLYPEAQLKGSAFYNRMAEIDQILQGTGDARYYAQDKPMLIAQMVAQEQGVAPRGRGTGRASAAYPQPPVPAYSGNPAAHLAPPVASGSARTLIPSLTSASAAIAAVRTPEQLETLKMQLMGR